MIDDGTNGLPWDKSLDPIIVPLGWKCVLRLYDGRRWERTDCLSIIVSLSRESDGRKWLHASVARPDRLPTYDDLCTLKYIFIGRHRKAIQVFAPESEHVNINPYCLHLWCRLDGDPLPDFTHGKGTL